MLGTLTYFLLFATLSGGMHLAIDTTAGERERKSLEPLLTLPVRAGEPAARQDARDGRLHARRARDHARGLRRRDAPLAAREARDDLELRAAARPSRRSSCSCPIAPLGAALMTLIASFTRTYREAQTYISFMLLVPTFPVLFASITNVEASLEAHVDTEPEPASARDGLDQGAAARPDFRSLCPPAARSRSPRCSVGWPCGFTGAKQFSVRTQRSAYVNARGPLLRARSRSDICRAGRVRSNDVCH